MSDQLIAALQAQLTTAQAEIGTLRKEAATRRKRGKAAEAQVAELQDALLALGQDRDTWQAQAQAEPDQERATLRAQVEELQGTIRTRDHRDAWAKAVTDLHDKATVEDLWQKVGYAPEGETADPAKITELVGRAREAVPYLFKPPAEAGKAAPGGAPAPAPARPAGPGVARGASESPHQPRDAAGVVKAQFEATGRSDPYRIA